MRIWTIHPRYLDRQGFLTLWREGLLAQAVLLGETRGYVHHRQFHRFRDRRSPVASIASPIWMWFNENRCSEAAALIERRSSRAGSGDEFRKPRTAGI